MRRVILSLPAPTIAACDDAVAVALPGRRCLFSQTRPPKRARSSSLLSCGSDRIEPCSIRRGGYAVGRSRTCGSTTRFLADGFVWRGRTTLHPADRSLRSTFTSATCSSSLQEGTRRDALYACVAEADDRHMVLVPAASALDAVTMARHAVDIWRASELAATEDSWRQRLATAQDLYRSST